MGGSGLRTLTGMTTRPTHDGEPSWLHKIRIALAVAILALTAIAVVDSASAGFYDGGRYGYWGFDFVASSP
jgi:hypothetical protein